MMNNIKHLYIHVPFCNNICYYCDFCHRIYNTNLVSKWLNTISIEIKDKCNDQYETIYIGGGTPSSLNINELECLLSYIKPYSKNVIEYTIEVNPDSLDIDKINLFKKYGINRVSMGVQSSNDEELLFLNRKHSFVDVKNKIKLLKENNITNISIDLLYSLPNQTMQILDKTLNDFLSLEIPHVSIYSLTIEENSVFGKKGISSLDSDIEADMYEHIVSKLNDNGYQRYEVSNFCLPGFESRHNVGYWKYDDFLGISLSSSSKIGNLRYTITSSFDEYFNDYNSCQEKIVLSYDDLKFENIMMSLRLNDGLNINEFNNKYNCDLLNEYKDNILMCKDLVAIKDDYFKCTNLELLNKVLVNFLK